MSDLKSLIRLRRWELDEKRRILMDLNQLAMRLEAEKKHVEDDMAREHEESADVMESSPTFGAYVASAIARRKSLESSISQVAERIETAAEELRESFRELKKYEVAQDSRDTEARMETLREENKLMDEIATEGHRRKG
ncbi:MAG TPA: hypothetical protein DCW68_03255 [Rhodospirillaceae bacterium]|nr:MAG: hypothetical protein A2018_06230 [Alphaproteobacteria bacterium GWF2_58_20]HAU29110.1 hypothetical protein [Rhodospirillaceae bacterium]